MSALRLGRLPDGTRHVVVEEPARGRAHGAGGVALGYFSGSLIITESERDRQLRMQREAMKRARLR